MRALDVYRNLRIELDKWESPTASITDFNYFWNVATLEFTDIKHIQGPDNLQADHDDIKDLLSDPTDISFGSGLTASLPSGYRNILDLKLILKLKTAVGLYAKDSTIISHPSKERTSRIGYIGENTYQQPKLKRSWYRLNKNKVTVIIDPNTTVQSAQMIFYQEPNTVYLNPEIAQLTEVQRELEENNSTLQFANHTVAKIIKICRRIMLENVESGRYNTVLNENNMTVK